MSLFPAYDGDKSKKNSNSNAKNLETSAHANVDWQRNQSFEVPAQRCVNAPFYIRPLGSDSGSGSGSGSGSRLSSGASARSVAVPEAGSGANLESSLDSDTDQSDSSSGSGSSSKPKEDQSDSSTDSDCSLPKKKAQRRSLEFDGDVKYYVDKLAANYHLLWKTLPAFTRPKYLVNMRRLIDPMQLRHRDNQKRKRSRLSKSTSHKEPKLSSKEIAKKTQRIQELQSLLANEPQQLDSWLELHQLLASTVTKSNRLAIAEQQMHKLETALTHHEGNEMLLKLYVETAIATYSDSQVASKLEEMLKRTPYEFILWKALIMTTQGSMARCTVPDVLLTYELCMERMQRKHLDKRPLSPRQSDELMMKLFHNCVLFMRQSGHFDQMFALLKLVLNLNLKNDNLKCLSACEENEAPLIEYEELVLRSGMPMHEIWTRVERLRQSYNFLPYSEMVANPRDWQRCIEPMQVSPFLFPMKCVESGMQLLLLVMQMMKLPFVRTDCLAERLCSRIDQIGDSEAIETLLVEMGDRFTYSLPRHSSGLDYSTAVIQMAKQLATSPTFMSHAIGHELYVDCIAQTLLACSDGLQDSSQRLVFLLLYIRFERLRLTMLKIGGQLKAEQCVQARQRLRDLLMRPANKEITCLYTEMAITEYETAPNNENVERSSKILNIILGTSPDYQDTQMVQALVVRVELLLAQEKRTEALHLLKCLALGKSPSSRPDEIIATPDELVQCSTRLLDAALAAMREQAGGAVDPMPLCDYFAPNRVVLLLRTHCLMLCLLNEVDKAFELLDRLLAEPHFALEPKELERTRCRFLREQVRELQLLLVFHIPSRHNTLGRRLRTVLEPALVEFPRNMAFLHRWSELWTLPWYKLRSRLIQCKVGILSVLHLIIAAHMRFSQYFSRRGDVEEDVQSAQQNQRLLQYNRSLNIFETFLPTNPHRSAEEADQYWILRRNSLYWRLYLRCLSTEQTSFERSKRCLLMALDECPWDKSLYMEGITSVPQETSNMQDIMIEKEVRIFALPDELSVLRDANQKNISKY